MRHGGSAGPGRLALPAVCRGGRLATSFASSASRGPAVKRELPDGAGSCAPGRGSSPVHAPGEERREPFLTGPPRLAL